MQTVVEGVAGELFDRLSAEPARALLERSHRREMRDGATLFREGDPASEVFVLVRGCVKVVRDTSVGREVVLHLRGPGDFVGCSSLLNQPTYSGSAVAIGDAVILAWPAALVHQLMAHHPDLMASILHMLGQRMNELRDKFGDLATQRVEQRIARTLTRLAHQSGVRTPEGIRVDFRLSRAELAELTGTTLFTASRVLSAWTKRGIIETDHRRLLIRHPHELVGIAEGLPAEERLR